MSLELTEQQAEILRRPKYQWRPIYWEPVDGGGERLMVGVVHAYEGTPGAARTIRDAVLDVLYGEKAAGARNLIDSGLRMMAKMARTMSMELMNFPVLGLHPGDLRATVALDLPDLLHTAVLLYSSGADPRALE